MTMQGAGQPISIGQARNECLMGNPIDANTFNLHELANVGASTRYAWSYWYGQTYLAPIQNILYYQVNTVVDTDYNVAVNFRTGTVTGDSNNIDIKGINAIRPAQANVGMYTGWSMGIAAVPGTSWRGPVTITQQPAPANDFTGRIYIDDRGPSGTAVYDVYFYFTASSRFG